MDPTATITAPATGTGGAIAVVRLSGPDALAIGDQIFRSKSGRRICDQPGYTLLFGTIVIPAPDKTTLLDEVIVSVFRAPHSYTGEDMLEFSCHASPFVVRELTALLIANGACTAEPGEFTVRAYLAGKLDLAQAEAVADLIASGDRAAHRMAVDQLRGGYSAAFAQLAQELLHLVSMLELELDFSEEDVEFADRRQIRQLFDTLAVRIDALGDSFALGNALKEGISVAIVGSPNAGKSTLLNTLLKEDRAMVSDIPGTTRDVIQEYLALDGIRYRFIDTAGIRDSDDTLEQMGISRSHDAIRKADIVLMLLDATAFGDGHPATLPDYLALQPHQHLCLVLNKCDAADRTRTEREQARLEAQTGSPVIKIAAKTGENLEALTSFLRSCVDTGALDRGETIVANARHHKALLHAAAALRDAQEGLEADIPTDMLVQRVREVIGYLNTVTGKEINSDSILQNIFSKFCIGK